MGGYVCAFVALTAPVLGVVVACTRAPFDPPLPGMARVAGGRFAMGGGDESSTDSLPIHEVRVSPFAIDLHETTNAEYEAFVGATGFVTQAERKLDSSEFPNVPPEELVPGSVCFHGAPVDASATQPISWWKYAKGAQWRHPEGPLSTLVGKERHPVVHVAWSDAAAYCAWVGKRLPTEAEWELASRGGKAQEKFSWGQRQTSGGTWMANVWQGNFPNTNTVEDGYAGTSPVGSFPPNGYGLHDMSGNVWEWCSDYYRPDYYTMSPSENPQGPASSFDPEEPHIAKRVLRGGSFLCSDQYCYRYTNAARNKGAVDTGASNIGFRCAKTL